MFVKGLLLLSCAGTRGPEAAPEATWDVRLVEGPWSDGEHVALAATGPKTLSGAWQGPAIVMATWLQQGRLLTSSSFDGGHGWTPPRVIAEGLQEPIEVDLALGSPILLAVRDGRPVRLDRYDQGWTETALGEGLASLDVVDGRGVVTLTTAQGLEVDGELAWSGEVCGRAAVRAEDLGIAVAFRERQPDGAVEVRMLVETFDDEGALVWEDRGLQTHSGWKPAICPKEGPVFQGRALVVTDLREGQRRLVVNDEVLPTEAGWDVLEVGSARGLLTWTAEQGAQHRLLVDGVGLLTSSEHRYVPAEPVDVGGELWLPFAGLRATVAVYRPAPEL